jgi:hypothetical protein
MGLGGNQGGDHNAGSGLPQGSPLSPVLFGLTWPDPKRSSGRMQLCR